MKKYVAAAVVAVMVFAFAAFAASLNVDGGVLQAGVDDDLTCADTANVTYSHHASEGLFWVTDVHVSFDEDCDGNTMYLAITDVGGVTVDLAGTSVTIPVDHDDPDNMFFGNPGIAIEDINDVNIKVFSDPDPDNEGQITGTSGYGFASGAFVNLWDGPSAP